MNHDARWMTFIYSRTSPGRTKASQKGNCTQDAKWFDLGEALIPWRSLCGNHQARVYSNPKFAGHAPKRQGGVQLDERLCSKWNREALGRKIT